MCCAEMLNMEVEMGHNSNLINMLQPFASVFCVWYVKPSILSCWLIPLTGKSLSG